VRVVVANTHTILADITQIVVLNASVVVGIGLDILMPLGITLNLLNVCAVVKNSNLSLVRVAYVANAADM
jgi:hypothetical protein